MDAPGGDSGPTDEFKWSLPIGSLLSITSGKDDTKLAEFPVTIHFDLGVAKKILAEKAYKDRKLGTKGSSINDKHQLLFYSQQARDRCSMALCALYYTQDQKRLQYTRGTEESGVSAANLGVVTKEGTLEKYTRGIVGIGKHPRYVQLKSNGVISWGKDKAKMKFSEKIVDVRERGAALDQFKLSDEENTRFFCVLTSGKSLYLLSESVADRKEWVSCIKSVIASSNPQIH
uniref:PH domain-containing protein n=1 Tax=Norrisiella sphaerica TaxID=552664 RepID=A0A7S2QSW0_9EUKA